MLRAVGPDLFDLAAMALRDPHRTRLLTPAAWDLFVRQARSAEILARVAALLRERALLDAIPEGREPI